MATQQIKGISSQYEEYRNQMKRSKKSEEYRNKRNQQMAEAQKLLNSNLPSEEIMHGGGNNPLNNNRLGESWQKQQNLLQPFRGTKSEFRNMDEKGKGQISHDEALKTRESNHTIESDELNQLTEDTSPVSFKDSTVLNTSDVRFAKLSFFVLFLIRRDPNIYFISVSKASRTEEPNVDPEEKSSPSVT